MLIKHVFFYQFRFWTNKKTVLLYARACNFISALRARWRCISEFDFVAKQYYETLSKSENWRLKVAESKYIARIHCH